jgi:hypothetical protein
MLLLLTTSLAAAAQINMHAVMQMRSLFHANRLLGPAADYQ